MSAIIAASFLRFISLNSADRKSGLTEKPYRPEGRLSGLQIRRHYPVSRCKVKAGAPSLSCRLGLKAGMIRETRVQKVKKNPKKDSFTVQLQIFSPAFFLYFFIYHIYPPFTRKQIVSLYFGRCVRTRLIVAISKVSGPPVFHIKMEASR